MTKGLLANFQVVAGQNYNLVFFVQKTNCSKKEFEKLNEDCEATTDSVSSDDVANGSVSNRQFLCNLKHTQSKLAFDPGFCCFNNKNFQCLQPQTSDNSIKTGSLK